MLYICPTPIGNLEDITLRVLSVLRTADLVACEDTRHTRILLDRYAITTRLVSFHEHNEDQRLEVLLPLLREGKDVAVVSDAGMPGLSDPGFTLVRACAAEGLAVTVLPGASAIPTAVVASGLPADRFAFVGFLPRGARKLVAQIASLDGTGAAVVAFEAPGRLHSTLKSIGSRWPDRRLAVCRELTKLHEQVVRGTAAEVDAALPQPVRGEIVLVLEPSWEADVGSGFARRRAAGRPGEAPLPRDTEERIRSALRELLEAGVGTKRAAVVVARLTGLPANTLYEMALAEKEREDSA
jgi:16S rRNA (cytidine1402-2'-O)-methyltransferase